MANKTIRAAMIIQGYHPLVGGAELQLASLAPLLQAQGVEIYILTRRHPGLASFEVINGVPVYRLPAPGPKLLASLSYTLSALWLVRKLNPHIIHSYNLFSPTTIAVTAKRLFGAPVVVKVLGGGKMGGITRLKKKTLGGRRMETFRQDVDAFITVSNEIDKELADLGVSQDRRKFIPNGVDTGRFKPLPLEEKQALRRSLELPDMPAPIVIFIGRLVPIKRVDLLLGIWPAIRAAHPEATLLILGTGSQEAELKQMAGPGMKFMGLIEDVAPYLKAADLFVLPSSSEGLPNALLEALAAGLPAVATAVGGTLDVIAHGENGWLVPPENPAALQEAILTLLADPAQRARLGGCGRETVIRNYSLFTTAERTRELYDQILSSRLAIS